MKCPIDGSDLVMTERQGIEIDYCPKCRGVWLDRGELDKIIDRSTGASPSPSFIPPQPSYPPARDDRRQTHDDPRYKQGHSHKKRRSGFLGELFDFD